MVILSSSLGAEVGRVFLDELVQDRVDLMVLLGCESLRPGLHHSLVGRLVTV